MKKIFEIKPIEYKHSPSVKDASDRFIPHLRPLKSKPLVDRPCIIIDNGSYECRAGWSFEETPFLKFRNMVAKPKTQVNKAIDAMHLVGDELNEFDAGKLAKRSMFDKNIVYHYQSLEHMLDYTFGHLGLAGESQIDYPLLMTEAMCNPNHCRQNMSELLFECYRVSAVSYSVDSLLSFYYNQSKRNENFSVPNTSGLIVSSSHQVSHIIPILDGQVALESTRRLALGGSHHLELLNKSLNLKYAQHKNTLQNPDAIQYIMENHTYCATNYREQTLYLEGLFNEERAYQMEEERKKREALYGNANADQGSKEEEKKSTISGRKIVTAVYKGRTQRQNEIDGEDVVDREDHIIQLPWQQEPIPTDDEIRRRHEMRKEQGQKLKEIMQRKREEKKRKMEDELADLQSLEAYREQNQVSVFNEEIQNRGVKNFEEYKKKIRLLQIKLGIKSAEEKKPDEEKYNLLEIADEFLSPEELKRKRIQKMQKTAAMLREERKQVQKIERDKIEEFKQSDPDSYLRQLYAKRKEIMDRIAERQRRKEEFSKRGSKAAQRRLQMMAEIGLGAENEGIQKKRGRPPAAQDQGGMQQGEDDDFGAADEDWDVYRGIAKDGFSDEEEDDQQGLNELEEQIAEIDPKFANLIYNTSKQPTAEDYQIRLWSDRYRGSEILFQPSIVGMENAGLSEILENILSPVSQAIREKILRCVFITGGHTQVPGFDKRIKQELTMINRAGTPINIVKSYDEQLDAWKGGAWLANNFFSCKGLNEFSISKAKYEECGHHYLKEHFCSNFLYGPKQGGAGAMQLSKIVSLLQDKVQQSEGQLKRVKV